MPSTRQQITNTAQEKTKLREQNRFQTDYLFSVALIYRISLTPRFSEVHGRLFYHNRFSGFLLHRQTAEAVRALSGVVNSQLKQGVNEKVSQR